MHHVPSLDDMGRGSSTPSTPLDNLHVYHSGRYPCFTTFKLADMFPTSQRCCWSF